MEAILDFRSKQFLPFLIYKSLQSFLPMFESIGLSVQEKKWKIDLQDCPMAAILGLQWDDFTFFVYKSTWCFPPSFESFGLSVQVKKWKKRFSRWPPLPLSWISDRNDYSFFSIYKSPRCFLPSFESVGLSVQEKKGKLDFQECCHGCLGFSIGTILAIFNLQITPVLPTTFESVSLSVQENKR